MRLRLGRFGGRIRFDPNVRFETGAVCHVMDYGAGRVKNKKTYRLTLKSTPRELRRMTRAERIESTLAQIFAPQDLRVEDQSARHHGHAGARPEGQTHFDVYI